MNKPLHSDQKLLELLQTDSEHAIDLLFRSHYAFLCQTVYRIIPDKNLVEDLTQDVFYELWRKRETIVIKTSIRAYLKRAARNKALNYIRGQKIKFEEEEKTPDLRSTAINSIQQMEMSELQACIDKAIDKLPERCRLVFSLSRFEEMSYKQIAEALDISIKTVENQISKALKLLRIAVAEYQQAK